jgi:hypothetical protein
MRGAPARAIQELAGHVDLSTTQRYMHLTPTALENAIRLLEPTPSRVIERERGVAHRYPDIDRRSALSLNRTDQAIT